MVWCYYCSKINNKFNLPPVPVPLMGLRKLIPFIGKTLFKRKPDRGPRQRDNSVPISGRWQLAFYLARSLHFKPTNYVSRTISHYPFFLYLFAFIFTSPLSFKMASIHLYPFHPLPLQPGTGLRHLIVSAILQLFRHFFYCLRFYRGVQRRIVL